MLEFLDSQAVESELDMLGSNDVVKLFDVLMQGSTLSREVRDKKGIIRGGVGWHIESDRRYRGCRVWHERNREGYGAIVDNLCCRCPFKQFLSNLLTGSQIYG